MEIDAGKMAAALIILSSFIVALIGVIIKHYTKQWMTLQDVLTALKMQMASTTEIIKQNTHVLERAELELLKNRLTRGNDTSQRLLNDAEVMRNMKTGMFRKVES